MPKIIVRSLKDVRALKGSQFRWEHDELEIMLQLKNGHLIVLSFIWQKGTREVC